MSWTQSMEANLAQHTTSGSDLEGEMLNIQEFRHRLLDSTKNEIRLCRILQPDSIRADCVSCEITHHVLDAPFDSPYLGLELRYRALSYCWQGDETDMHTILVNKKPFQIRKSLHKFLGMIQHNTTNTNFFWIDQLCINQNSTFERNHQVRLMSVIYSQAEAVCVWLGDADETTYGAFGILRELDEGETHIGKSGDFVLDPRLEHMLSRCSWNDIRSLMTLFSNTYWARVWIVQEVFLANELFLLCGPNTQRVETANRWNHTIHNNARIEFFLALAATQEDSKIIRDALRLLGRRSARKASFSTTTTDNDGGASWMEPHDTFLSTAPRHCTNPLDQIYGFQACLAPNRRVLVDYSKSAVDLFVEQISGPCRYLDHIDFELVGQRLELPGALPDKCYTIEKMRKAYGKDAFLEAVASSGIDLMSDDPQLELCGTIMEDVTRMWSLR